MDFKIDKFEIYYGKVLGFFSHYFRQSKIKEKEKLLIGIFLEIV